MSSDTGITWTADNIGLKDTIVRALAISGNYIFAGTDSGRVWRMEFPVLGINEWKNDKNSISVYPNPATCNITIDAGNFRFTNFDLQIFDVVGNLILEKNTRPKQNRYRYFIALPYGIYIVESMTRKGYNGEEVC